LEGERTRQEETIAKQALEIEVFKNTTKECEDKLRCSTDANEGQREQLPQLKEENKGMKAKEDRLMGEVGKLKEEIRPRVARQDSLVKELVEVKDLLNKLGVKQFAPSMKKGKGKDR
jgi:chromosome segregation ATPase